MAEHDFRQQVRQILMQEWNPAGQRGVAAALDEYELYVGRVYGLLLTDFASEDYVADFLMEAAGEMRGEAPSDDMKLPCLRTAEKLMALKASWPTADE